MPLVLSRRNEAELLDNPNDVLVDLPGNLRDLRILNRWFGGTSIAFWHVQSLLGKRDNANLLDVATGSADIPASIRQRLARKGIALEVVGLDSSEEVLAEARSHSAASVRLVQGDAEQLPWPDETFDIVTCCLAIHHFETEAAVRVLSEMWRVARVGVIVVDLRRGALALAGTWIVTRTVARNPVTRHDGPLSVWRAFTPAEMAHLVTVAGWRDGTLYRHRLFRQAVVARKVPLRDV